MFAQYAPRIAMRSARSNALLAALRASSTPSAFRSARIGQTAFLSTTSSFMARYEPTRLTVEDLNNNVPTLGLGSSAGVHGVETAGEVAGEEASAAEAVQTKAQVSGIRAQLPQVVISSKTTLGELYDGIWAKYKNKAAVVVLLWSVLLYTFMWNPYISEAEREAAVKKANDLI